MSNADDPRVLAIRADELVGHATCSSIDECFEPDELVEKLDEWEVTTPSGAVTWARDHEQLWLEQGTNASSGEEGCPLVAEYRRFKAKRAELESKSPIGRAK